MRETSLRLCGVLASAALLFGAEPVGGSDAAPLVGVWDGSHVTDNLHGSILLTVEKAQVAGQSARVWDENGDLAYRFAGRGALRVAYPMRNPIAFWIQPPTVGDVAYATPVNLRMTARDRWTGVVDPLPDRIAMSLYVQRDATGTVTAFLRDPLYNFGRSFRTMKVAVSGKTVNFTGSGPALSATLDAADSLTLALPDSSVTSISFARRTVSEAPLDATYEPPADTGDGWPTGSASQAGLSVPALEELTRYASAGLPTSVTSPFVHSISIVRHGKLVFDRYFAPFDAATLHDTRSAGKTYADVLAGAVMQAGVNLDARTRLLPLFGRYGALDNPDPRKAAITLGDALSMSTGLDCDDNDEHSVANEDNMQSQSTQPDWYKLVLDSRMVRDPGTKAVYCSASINLAGGAIASAAHAWLPALFARYVAGPLQMQRYALNLSPSGDWYLGGGAYVRPRDFLKLGQLFLDDGTWHGRRVLSHDWIQRSWSTHLELGPGDGYAFAWHVRSYSVDGFAFRAYEAQGNGGQILDVIPQLDLAVMITQGNYNNYGTWGPMRDAIVTRIIKAIPQR